MAQGKLGSVQLRRTHSRGTARARRNDGRSPSARKQSRDAEGRANQIQALGGSFDARFPQGRCELAVAGPAATRWRLSQRWQVELEPESSPRIYTEASKMKHAGDCPTPILRDDGMESVHSIA